MRVTALAGGTGAAKLLRGLVTCLEPGDLTVIGNTGDDTRVWGLPVSPDLDTVTYALAGLLDAERSDTIAPTSFSRPALPLSDRHAPQAGSHGVADGHATAAKSKSACACPGSGRGR